MVLETAGQLNRLLSGLLISAILSLFVGHLHAAETDENDLPVAAISLSDLAAKSDLVAVVQVRDTDYVYARDFPNEGSAFLRILIAYKQNRQDEEIIEVFDTGLHPNECYFEGPTVLEEGRRYLIFFRIDPEYRDRYRGFPEGCALEVFVAEDNRYALKYPSNGILLSDPLDALAMQFEFRDNYALVSYESLSPTERKELLEKGLIIPYKDEFKYTRGVDLTTVRNLISSDALKPKSSWEMEP